ncbi:glycosyltransferase family 4 protein [Velocimicrobium porci]|uniref:Glycosyltransferase n=1 Tax=Velocimicrobium porci TaxID=2606634 RepID=A0A6L5Y052_9FIRM|nr:glycosyltransferase [Velocimicrobium porci]MSS64500.1 glycosyltransferase [Velocimicrobium porci]
MKIIQVLPTIAYGDAVGNDTIALYRLLQNTKYETGIYAENIDTRLSSELVRHLSEIPDLEKEDIILYHLSTGTKLNYELEKYNCRKIIIYHNITPPDFFEEYSNNANFLCSDGLRGMKYLAQIAEYCLADSGFNKTELLKAGYQCKIDVLPILIPFTDYQKTPNRNIINKYSNDDYVNILFTGRIAPNKKQEDLISAFSQYTKHYNKKARLFIVGSYNGMEKYYDRLRDYVEKLNLDNVYFTGHIKFDEILAYYKIADLFVCMSEHEGFCVPLVEAMYFEVPILAYDSSAIAETLGGSGFLTNTKNPVINAAIINRIMTDETLKKIIVQNEKERLMDFNNKIIEEKFLLYLESFLGEKNEK